MAKVGRPVTKSGSAAEKARKAARDAYRALPEAKKKARVQNRSKAAQRAADARRLAKDRDGRNAYHRKDARAVQDVPKGAVCAKCGSTKNVQRHVVNGKFRQYLCGRCNVQAIGK